MLTEQELSEITSLNWHVKRLSRLVVGWEETMDAYHKRVREGTVPREIIEHSCFKTGMIEEIRRPLGLPYIDIMEDFSEKDLEQVMTVLRIAGDPGKRKP